MVVAARRTVRGANGGYTVLEMLMVVTILTILTVIAVPSYTRIIAAQRVKTISSDLFVSLLRARAEAVKRSTNITVTPTAAGWQGGWSIPDPNPLSTTGVIESHGASTGVTVTGPVSVIFQSSGRVNATTPSCGSSPPVACFVITSSTWSGARSCVSIDLSGRPYSASGVSTC